MKGNNVESALLPLVDACILATMTVELIATVALRANLGPTGRAVLSYRVPPPMHDLVQPGQLVWAPLRRSRVQGIVLSVEPGDATGLRELEDLGDPAAQLTPAGLELAAWVAETYRAPLYDVLGLLLPPGVGQEADSTWRATAEGMAIELGSLPERERAVLYYLRSHGEQSERSLRRVLRGADADLRLTYAALAERGLLVRGQSQTKAAARPHRLRVAKMLVPTTELEAALSALSRAPAQAAALRQLAEKGGRVPVAELDANSALLQALARRGLVTLEWQEVRRDPLAGLTVPADQPPTLSQDQQAAYTTLIMALERERSSSSPSTFLLHGITGSGKTEIYLRVIARALRLGRQVLVLVPEIALTAQLVRRFAARFPGQLAVLHSRLALGERYDEWRRLRRGEARLAIGSRSAVFAPLPELGLVIVDEEHELSYKHDATPRYQARDVALHLAAVTGSVAILGSATPAVESYQQVLRGNYRLLELRERLSMSHGPTGLPQVTALPLPPVRLIDMRQELERGNRSIFSQALQQALAATLTRGAQSILFLNRRGAASFVMCRDCGYVVSCGACSGPMTVHHETGSPTDRLVCHTCGVQGALPYVCPRCLSRRVRSFGVGTQRVAEEVASLFPQARVLRWDRDTAATRGAHERMLDAVLRAEVDILVGTQMIAKGLDLPLVNLVGVVAADTGLHLPDFRSGERAFQLLTQVAGRAGRRNSGAQVIIQSYTPEHYALRAAQEHDYRSFFREEIAFRRTLGYPPFSRMVRFIYTATTPAAARQEAEQLAEQIHSLISERSLTDWGLIGPAPAFMQRSQGRWRWHLILRAPNPSSGESLTSFLDALAPLQGWIVDVDPAHVL